MNHAVWHRRLACVFTAETAVPHSLLLIGAPALPIPDDPRIRHLGFLDEQDKYDALAGAEILLVPSPYESLSMVTLEAMALGVPVVVNGRCDVLRAWISSNSMRVGVASSRVFCRLSILAICFSRSPMSCFRSPTYEA